MRKKVTESPSFLIVDRDRSLVSISGNDRIEFLQGLITNDLLKVDEGIIYTAILSPQGKYLFDFFIVQNLDQRLFIDIQSNKKNKLLDFLNFYKLNSDVYFEEVECIVVLGNIEIPINALKDPRSNEIGWRLYDLTSDYKCKEFGKDNLEKIRVSNCIPKTDEELIFQQTYILETHFEKLNGVDFSKGCYIGQEVTARMKHKGTLKKLFHPAEFRELPDKSKSKEVFSEGRVAGEVFSIAYPFCIIKLRQEFKEKNLIALGSELKLLN